MEPIEQENIKTSNFQHYAAIHHKKCYVQPKEKDMAIITNNFKETGCTKRYTPQELLHALGNGRCVMLSNFEIDNQNNFRFISTTAFAIDVDDEEKVTNPKEILNMLYLKDICMGLFYTFSHGKKGKGNRYRLFFQLDQPITNLEDYMALVEYVMEYLKQRDLPIDESGALKYPTQIIRPGILGYEVNDFSVMLPVKEWLPEAKVEAKLQKAKRERERKAKAEKFKDRLFKPITYEELKEMCKAIGYIPSGGTKEKWLQIVYALKYEVTLGNLTDEQGYELFCIVSGKEASERQWKSMKPRGKDNPKDEGATVGSIIKHAEAAGYKRKHAYNYALQETFEAIPTEVIKVDGHLSVDILKELIGRKESLILHSPTGSWKTTCSINACKELAYGAYEENQNLSNQNSRCPDWHYYVFCCPTIPLTEQVAKDHNLPCTKGGMKWLENKMTGKAVFGCRVFVATYDKAAELVRHLIEGIDYEGRKPHFTLVVDEIHKFTDAYNYRYKVIDKIKGLADNAASFIGLSGTPEDILKDDFDKLIKIDTGNDSSPCTDYRVFTYEKMKDADIMLIPVIRGLLQETRVLLFINNKDRIKRIRDLLRKEGIKTQIVSSDNKQSPTYLNIVENGTIAEDVNVVIATSVLADGISIKNDPNWSCLVVCDKASQFFNPSTVKQISNRFRGQYRCFGLYMMQPNPHFIETNRFNIESDFQYRKRIVSGYVEELNEEFKEDGYKEFIPFNVERDNGIFYRSQDQQAIIEFNPLFVRHQSMKRKEKYYGLFRNAYIEEVGKQLGVNCTGVINVNLEVEKNGFDLTGLLQNMEAQQEQEKKENAELREAFSRYFDKSVYKSFLNDEEEMLEVFKKQVHPEQFAATRRNVTIADYETCKTVGEKIKRKADTNKYYNHIKGLANIAALDFIKGTTVTKKVFKELLKMTNEKYSSNEFKDIIQNKLRKTLNVQASDVKAGLELFHEYHPRSAKARFTQIKPLTVKIVANIHGLSETAVKNSVLKYVWQRNGHQQKILLQAIFEKWGIEKYQN
ncbi:DEAD/DEAH box helicase family protein [Bacillus sp. UNC41MFS5]|uniref:DEAD/DEAH box helicase family protein n=1 Tax=Bacillus sp. UNC41MFS5 TaxID=1449046 RepID=UPI0012DEFD2D|nr:DEAD/DEAH box helicase family protein [Bacillus sp. UNC41MFS5]